MKYSLQSVVDDYYNSYEFNNLRDETKKQYQYHLKIMLDTVVESKAIRDRQCDKVSSRMAKLAYNQWCDRGIHLANHVLSTSRILFNHGLHMEMTLVNPFLAVKKRPVSVRRTVWSRQQVQGFLDSAYGDFSTRNVGLIAQMAYEWCQRLGDMRLLTWDALDLSGSRVYIKQSKRKAEVFLPISQQLTEMLIEQESDFGFQPYVAPMTEPIRGVYKPYTVNRLPKVARRIMRDAGLPDELRLSDLRRTGTTEMVEAGVSMGNIMSVTGHANPQSVKPYMKNTFASADLALTSRQNRDIKTS
jgi:integrase|tara:strand:- start:1171 stop:2073 length:903 start_codon:yes stop_codon:yes gene_type:complete